ncbi:TetR/AcrR family transcriptional regulator [Nocardiopsis halotolerans]|uniref:TetR/AcrR family transcriptional regulator n=1 Tax=Nocardiopsis halotolerans TaxID=124252 RepID=UPI000346BB05|nr:TetR/AcrR family transcriptional regulator C-terminal domain-containing protein [Nocardiopsis halotolerans]
MADRRGQPLNRERIVGAAIELADAEGLDAVSMRRVAARLGAGAMSLYRHVSDKEQLVLEMAEELTARHAYPDDPGDLDWRGRIHLMARHDWDMYTSHPWILTVVANLEPPVGPHGLAAMEWALRAVEPLGLSLPASARAIMTVTHYLQGSARMALSASGPSREDSDPGAAWQRRLGGADLSRYPRVQALVTSDYMAERGGRDWVTSGLDVVLDGIAAEADRSR